MKWLALRIGGQTWSVYLVSPNSKHLRNGRDRFDGRCRFDTCRIYINRTLSKQLRDETLLHEVLHVVVRVSGMWEVLEGAVGVKPAGRADEAFVTTGSLILHRLLQDLGFRFPRSLTE